MVTSDGKPVKDVIRDNRISKRMTYYQELLQSCPPPPSGSPFGKKQDGYDARLAQAQLLSQLMRRRRPFCFLRMGDMELAYLLAQQEQRLEGIDFRDGPTSGT